MCGNLPTYASSHGFFPRSAGLMSAQHSTHIYTCQHGPLGFPLDFHLFHVRRGKRRILDQRPWQTCQCPRARSTKESVCCSALHPLLHQSNTLSLAIRETLLYIMAATFVAPYMLCVISMLYFRSPSFVRPSKKKGRMRRTTRLSSYLSISLNSTF